MLDQAVSMLITVFSVGLLATGLLAWRRWRRGEEPLDSEGWVGRHSGLLLAGGGVSLVACAVAVRDTVELAVALGVPGAFAMILGPVLSRLEGPFRFGSAGFEGTLKKEARAQGLDVGALEAVPALANGPARTVATLVEQHEQLLVPAIEELVNHGWSIDHAEIQRGWDAIAHKSGVTMGVEPVITARRSHLRRRLHEMSRFQQVDIALAVLPATRRSLTAGMGEERFKFAFVDGDSRVDLPELPA